MGLRYRKSIKIAPGLKVNVGKKSVGISAGNKYFGATANTRTGVTTRVSAPGTGAAYTHKIGNNSNKTTTNVQQQSNYIPKQKETNQIDKTTALLLCIFFGYFGVHKFYEGKIGMGILYVFTFGLFFFGWLIDIILIATKPNPYYV